MNNLPEGPKGHHITYARERYKGAISSTIEEISFLVLDNPTFR